MSTPIQVDLDALLRSNKPLLKKQNGPGELSSSKESSNMLRSTIVGSISSANNLTFSIINQDSLVNDFSSLHNTNKSKQSHYMNEDINDSSSHVENKFHPKINIINRSNQDDDNNNDYHNELMQKCPYIQDSNDSVCKKTLGKDFFRSCGKLETIQETNSEISCLKKDALSTPNYHSSVIINNNLIGALDERNFFSKAESIVRNFNSDANNTSQDEGGSFLSHGVSTVKEIERLFEDKSSLTKHDNNSECLTRVAVQNEEANNHITNNSEITMITNRIKSSTYKINTDDKEQSCSNIVCDISIKSNKNLRDNYE